MQDHLRVGPSPTSLGMGLGWKTLLGLPRDAWVIYMNGWEAFQSIVMCNQSQSIMQQSITRSWIPMHPSCVFGCIHTCI